MCGLAINIARFAHLLRKVDFDAVFDHLVIVHIMRSKVEPTTTRIKRLLAVLSAYSFNLYYMKGKDMILSDFLSRQDVEESGNPHEIIPISFNLRTVLQDRYYSLGKEKYMIQTRSQTKASSVKLTEVHRVKKGLDPHKIPDKQPQPIVRPVVEKKPRLGQGRAGMRRKIKLALPSISQEKRGNIIGQNVIGTKPITSSEEAQTGAVPTLLPEILSSELPSYIILDRRPPPNPPYQIIKKREEKEVRSDIEENSPFQESIISEIYERLDKSYFLGTH